MMSDGEDRSMEEDREIQKVYRRLMQEEIDWQEVRKEKKEFISRNFEPAGFSLRPVHVLVPVFVVSLAAAAGLLLLPEKVPAPAPDLQAPAVSMEAGQPAGLPVQPKPAAPPKSVMVESLSSDMGTPMVFSQTEENLSLVVIWIFPSGKG